jgi:hypothetical protein
LYERTVPDTLPFMRKLFVPLTLLAALLVLPAIALAHPERTTFFPDHTKGERPKYKNSGTIHIVCRPDSRQRINRIYAGSSKEASFARRLKLKQLNRCKFQEVQKAVDAASTGARIFIMPGVYEEPSARKVPFNDPKCSMDDPKYWEPTDDSHGENGKVATYQFQWDCKNSRNLVQILGDDPDDPDRVCDQKCGLRIQGMGKSPEDVVLVGDRKKRDVIRADRADGIIIAKLTTEQASFNGIDVVETNGFVLDKTIGRFNQNYGMLTFTSDNGLYNGVEGYGNGDSGIYPGSGPEGHCQRYGIEIKNSSSHDNVLGQSGTAGNGTYVHDSKWFNNGTGIVNDSFASGHPGMPQDCSKWENNDVYSNNRNFFEKSNQEYCAANEFESRPRDRVCPQFQSPVGTGFVYYGANGNIIRKNRVWDNHRWGFGLFWVPAAVRGDTDPAVQTDTSNENRVLDNWFGEDVKGDRSLNGLDIMWDEQGIGNCFGGNTGPGGDGRSMKSDPATLPTCASGGSISPTGNTTKLARQASCATWDPKDNQFPPGCDWFDTPPKPER